MHYFSSVFINCALYFTMYFSVLPGIAAHPVFIKYWNPICRAYI